MPGFRLELQVQDVSISQFWISLANPSSKFEPQGVMSLDLEIRGRTYPVRFLGAVFNFPAYGLQGISFLRIEQNPPTT